MCVSIGTVVGAVVVAIIVRLLLPAPAVVLPKRLVERRAMAMVFVRMMGMLPMQEANQIAAGANHFAVKII